MRLKVRGHSVAFCTIILLSWMKEKKRYSLFWLNNMSNVQPVRQLNFLITQHMKALCNCMFSHISISSECRNISASVTEHYVENLSPGGKYDIVLAGVTRAGKGPEATVTISTLPEDSWMHGMLNPKSLYLCVKVNTSADSNRFLLFVSVVECGHAVSVLFPYNDLHLHLEEVGDPLCKYSTV